MSRLRAADLKDEPAARLTRNRVEGADLQVDSPCPRIFSEATQEAILADG